jgi:cytochrome c-type biogenesis protein CcmH/NrfG
MAAIKLGANTAQLWSIIGRCEREFGEPEKAITALTKSLQLESTHKEALLEMAVTYMSISNARKALEYLDKCLALDPLLKNAHGYKGLLLQNMGRAKDTITAFMEAYRIDPMDTQALQFIAVSYAAMGDYGTAIEWFEKTLLADPDHYVWCLREMAYYRWRMIDVPFAAYNPDTDLHWMLKDAWIRRAPLRNYCGPGLNPWCHYKLSLHDPSEVRLLSAGSEGIPMEKFYNSTRRAQFQELVSLTAPISRWIQVDSPGFLKHERQHKMFGVMVLQIAQHLVSHYRLLRSGLEGLRVPNSSRSRRVLVGKEEEVEAGEGEGEGPEGDHVFGWRDLYDIAVKWRQVAEPFDTVLWIDCTAAQEDQADKVGLQTFLYHGMGKNIRYYPYFNQTFTLLKRLTPQGFYVGTENFSFKLPPKESLPAIERARSLKEYLEALQPLYVLTPLLSRATPQEGALEGHPSLPLPRAFPSAFDSRCRLQELASLCPPWRPRERTSTSAQAPPTSGGYPPPLRPPHPAADTRGTARSCSSPSIVWWSGLCRPTPRSTIPRTRRGLKLLGMRD